MSIGVDKFQAQLVQDVESIYKAGFDSLAQPQTLPALAELAYALGPDAEDCGDAIEGVLHGSIASLARKTRLFLTRKTNEAKIKVGLTELFGLGEERGLNLTDRRDRAGPPLGYPNGDDGMRKAKRDKQDLTYRIVEELTQCLMELAAIRNFSYTRRFESDLSGYLTPLEEVNAQGLHQAGRQGIGAATLSTGLLKDLYTICTDGLEAAAAGRSLTVLNDLARHTLKTDESDSAQAAIEAILAWTVDQVGKDSSWQRTGLRLFLGLDDDVKGKTLTERCELADTYIGGEYDPDYLFPGWAVELLRATRNWLVILAIETDYRMVSDHWRLDGGLIRFWEQTSRRV
jgi:hypothetical protein